MNPTTAAATPKRRTWFDTARSAIMSTRREIIGDDGVKHRDRVRLCRAMRKGMNRWELAAVVLCRFQRFSQPRAARALGMTLPALREALASYDRRVAEQTTRRDREERIARTVERQQAAKPVYVACEACGAKQYLLPGDPRVCQTCLEPITLTRAEVALLAVEKTL